MAHVLWGVDRNTTLAFSATTAMTASTHRVALLGVVAKSGTIDGVGFRFGAVTRGATSALTVSLQDVSLTSGPPGQPDGTQDQTATVAAGSIVSNTWVNVTLGTTRSVTVGDLLAVVIEYSVFNAGDSIALSNMGISSTAVPAPGIAGAAFYDGSTWTAQNAIVNVVLSYNDGTATSFLGGMAASSSTSTAYNSGSTPDERGMVWTPTKSVVVTGLAAHVTASGDFDLVMYDSASVELRRATIDANFVRSSAQRSYMRLFSSPLTVTAGQTYYLSILPTTATSITAVSVGLSSATHREAWPLGTDASEATRTNAGAWSTSTTSRPPIGILIDPDGPATSGLALPVVRGVL